MSYQDDSWAQLLNQEPQEFLESDSQYIKDILTPGYFDTLKDIQVEGDEYE